MSQKIKELEQKILKNKNLYYQGKPEISDFEYDELEESLRKIDPNNSVLNFVGSEIFANEKVQHEIKMLSLNKTYKIDELLRWQDSEEIVSTYKIDGSSCSLIYSEGALVLAKTRGDGRFGEKITNKAVFIPHIPHLISHQSNIEIRGEIYCTEENFILLAEKMSQAGLEKPTSQRNIVAGLLGRKENIELCQYLSFQAFELISENLDVEKEEEKFKKLIKFGFETPEYFVNKKKEDIQIRLEEAQEFISSGSYLIDGLVFTYNKLSLHDKLGETAHHPRYKMAFKFQGETKVTKIKSISWQVSRNGYLTPVANVEPVELSGAKVSRVTLHNFGMVAQFELKKNDLIEVVRSGEVIPKFLSVVKSSEDDFVYPKTCPSCSEETYIEQIRLVCKNEACPDKVKDEILNFIQKIGIDDLSSKRLEELIRLKIITDIPSLYEVTLDQLLSVDKVKDKLAQKIMTNINNSKDVSLIVFLSSLGISRGAYNKCEKIVENGYNSIEKILNLTASQLELIESFAEKSANEFVISLQSKKEMIIKLMSYGFHFKKENAIKTTKITELKFCITGTLTMKRSALQKLIKQNGGIVQNGVTSTTDFLLTNDTESSSSKFKKAKELSVKIITETEFLKMIEDENGED